MQEGLVDFIAQPRQQTLAPTSQALYFILDQALYPDLLQALTALEVYTFDFLYIATDCAALANVGPIWLSVPSASAVAEGCMRLCQQHHAGIAISAANGEQALNHARWLLKMNDGSGGRSWVTYYQPALFAALLGTTEASAMNRLLGPWSAVHLPSPRHIDGLPSGWLSAHTQNLLSLPSTPLFTLSPRTGEAYATLRWVYWIDQHHLALNVPEVTLLPALIDNLELLCQHQICESTHLLQLANLMVHTRLASQAAAMAILSSTEPARTRVKRLRTLIDLPASETKPSPCN